MTSRSPGKKTTDKPIRRGGRTLLAYPLALEHWDRHRNGALTPDQVSHGSNRVVWWICRKAPDHVWQESAHQRVRSIARGFGCPFCSGRRPSVTNSLATLFPQAAAEWHPSRNGKLLPEHVAAHSQKRAWWRCSKNPSRVERDHRSSYGVSPVRLPVLRRSIHAVARRDFPCDRSLLAQDEERRSHAATLSWFKNSSLVAVS
jgi:hypothetical protein